MSGIGLPRNAPVLVKKRETEKQELETRRQDTQNSQNVAEWRASIEARIEAMEDRIFNK